MPCGAGAPAFTGAGIRADRLLSEVKRTVFVHRYLQVIKSFVCVPDVGSLSLTSWLSIENVAYKEKLRS